MAATALLLSLAAVSSASLLPRQACSPADQLPAGQTCISGTVTAISAGGTVVGAATTTSAVKPLGTCFPTDSIPIGETCSPSGTGYVLVPVSQGGSVRGPSPTTTSAPAGTCNSTAQLPAGLTCISGTVTAISAGGTVIGATPTTTAVQPLGTCFPTDSIPIGETCSPSGTGYVLVPISQGGSVIGAGPTTTPAPLLTACPAPRGVPDGSTCIKSGTGFAIVPLTRGTAVTVTEVVSTYTTVCPTPTQFAVNNVTYTATGSTTITVTNCPCTLVDSTLQAGPQVTPAPTPVTTLAPAITTSSVKYTGAADAAVPALGAVALGLFALI